VTLQGVFVKFETEATLILGKVAEISRARHALITSLGERVVKEKLSFL
jgi:hypothetical protein